MVSQPFMFVPLSPIFPSFPSKELSMGSVRFYRFLNTFSSFWASWVVLAAAHFGFWEVQGISNTPRIISPLGKSHQMVFNLAHCYSGFPNLSCLSLFLPYSLHFPPKNSRWKAFGFIGFWTLFPASGRAGWFWKLLTLVFEKCNIVQNFLMMYFVIFFNSAVIALLGATPS